MADSQVTIIVVPREQFSKAETSLDSIYAVTPAPFELVYVDGNSPPHLRRHLEQQAKLRRFTLVRTEHYLTSNEARNIGLRHARTPYVVFLDNDVAVGSGWLEALVGCAEQTGAWAVGPLYCYGVDGASVTPYIVHTAGAELRIIDDGGRRLHEKHRHVDRLVSEVLPELHREPIDLVEFHCMLVRRSALERVGPLDEQLLSFLDHLDFCMAVHRLGGAVYFEPASVVTHLAPPPFARMDIPFFLLRWSDAWLYRSARYFASKHGLALDDEDLQGHVWFRNGHRRRLLAAFRGFVSKTFGRRGRKLMDTLADRIVFGMLVEHTLVRWMELRRGRMRRQAGQVASSSAAAEAVS